MNESERLAEEEAKRIEREERKRRKEAKARNVFAPTKNRKNVYRGTK